ncbi:MAG: hypothetical protein JWM43_1672 [Acidobacteriaceae bacterium]|nr:hypothetical protein [Acidobacteriaceae bacterium]
MNQNFEFDDATQGMDYAGISPTAGGCVATVRRELTAEDVLYRVATVSAVLFLLITML